MAAADVLVMGVPSHGMRDAAKQLAPFLRPWVPVVSLSKGLEQGTRLRMTQVLEAELPGHPCGVLTGPNLAKEILAGDAAATVIAMDDPVIAEALQHIFANDLFRVYTNPDVIGCEVAGALKNVMAIASGMADGLGTGDNTRSAVITRGLSELTRLGCAMGGQQVTFAGLAGMGDLIATCISPQSRNRYVGEQLGRGPQDRGDHRRDAHGRRGREDVEGRDGAGRRVRRRPADRRRGVRRRARGPPRRPTPTGACSVAAPRSEMHGMPNS